MNAKIEKSGLHPRNPHRFRYDFARLQAIFPELTAFVIDNPANPTLKTIDFSDPNAVRALNAAILLEEYNIKNWDIPEDYLCPAIPSRADYMHYIADLLAEANGGEIPIGEIVCGLDIGTGSNLIYPILGNSSYGWHFVATDIDALALENCAEILKANPKLIEAISLQQQMNSRFIFKDIIQPQDHFAFTICNPPFYTSKAEAEKSSLRKVKNLKIEEQPLRNFGGKSNELWCAGGELAFTTQMIFESRKYPMQCLWFTTLVSKHSVLTSIYKVLAKVEAADIKTIEMSQGQKTSRIVAWSFQSESQRKSWKF